MCLIFYYDKNMHEERRIRKNKNAWESITDIRDLIFLTWSAQPVRAPYETGYKYKIWVTILK